MAKEKERGRVARDFKETATTAENTDTLPESARKGKVERVKARGKERTEKEKENTDGRHHHGNGDGRAADGRMAAGRRRKEAHT